MANLRFDYVVFSNVFYVFLYAIPKANRMIKDENATDQEKFDFACKIIDRMRKRSRTETIVTGTENLPEDDNYIMYSNHQGKYDALGILLSLKDPCSVLWEKKPAERILSRQICGLLDAVKIDLDDIRDKVRAMREVTAKSAEGRNFLIFPEGGYDNNKNELQEFFAGCFSCAIRTGKPIVPVAIYDSYKAMNSNTFEKVITQVHFLPAIRENEYRGMRKNEISDMVFGRISEKLKTLKSIMP